MKRPQSGCVSGVTCNQLQEGHVYLSTVLTERVHGDLTQRKGNNNLSVIVFVTRSD